MSNFFKFLRALVPGTVLYDHAHNQLFVSCGCESLFYRFFFGLNLKSEMHGITMEPVKIELIRVKNLRNFTIIGKMK